MIARFLKTAHLLSFDVALGAVICQRFFSKILNTETTWIPSLALGICVLLIYNVDHLIDSKMGDAATPRRAFYYRNQRAITALCSVLLIIGIGLLPVIHGRTLTYGLWLAVLCGAYLTVIYFFPRLWFKEMFVACCYTAGVVLAPLSQAEIVTHQAILLILQFGILALINLLLFSVYDFENDLAVGFSSLVIKLGKAQAITLLYGLFVGALGLEWIIMGYGINTVLFFAMTVWLIILTFFRDRFAQNDLYRILGDAVFFVPIVGLL